MSTALNARISLQLLKNVAEQTTVAIDLQFG